MDKSENKILERGVSGEGREDEIPVPTTNKNTSLLDITREPQILTVEEVAERLKVSPATIYGILRAGEMTSYKVGRAWRVDEEDLNQYIQKQKLALSTNGIGNRGIPQSRK